VEKCFGAAKAGTKAKANDIILMYAEIDVADPVVVGFQKDRLLYQTLPCLIYVLGTGHSRYECEAAQSCCPDSCHFEGISAVRKNVHNAGAY
jgi:hypothetical protein